MMMMTMSMMLITLMSPRAHLHVVGMLGFMSDKLTELADFVFVLFCSCVYFYLCGPFNCISFHKFSRQLRFLTLFFRPNLRLIGPFNYISLSESLLQP